MAHSNKGIEHSKHLEVHREDLQEAEASLHGHGQKQHILPTKPGEERRVTEKQLGEAAATGSTKRNFLPTSLSLHADIESHTFLDEYVACHPGCPKGSATVMLMTAGDGKAFVVLNPHL